MSESVASFFQLAFSRKVVVTALRVALIVGSLLALINHGSSLLILSLSSKQVLQIVLTYFVPYCVSSYSAVRAIQALQAVTSEQ